MIWADPKRGMSMAMTMGLNMDELRITADPAGAVSSQLSAKGLTPISRRAVSISL